MIQKISDILGLGIETIWSFFYGIFLLFIGMFYPVFSLVFFAGFLIFFDLITGIWASKKRGEEISSKKLSRTIAKVILYPLGIILAYLCEFFLKEIPFIKGVTFLLIITEGKSLDENLKDILGFSFFKYIKAYLIDGKNGLMKEMEKKEKQSLKKQ